MASNIGTEDEAWGGRDVDLPNKGENIMNGTFEQQGSLKENKIYKEKYIYKQKETA